MIGAILAGALGGGSTDIDAFESIATINVGASGAATYSFTNISQDYQHLQLRVLLRTNLAGYALTAWTMRVGNGSADSGSNYTYHRLFGNGSSVTLDGAANQTNAGIYTTANNATAGSFYVDIVDFLDYKNTNKFKTLRQFNGYDSNGSGQVMFNSYLWRSTSAINTIEFTVGGSGVTAAQYSQFALYGIKG
jgi:hypothetical protein